MLTYEEIRGLMLYPIDHDRLNHLGITDDRERSFAEALLMSRRCEKSHPNYPIICKFLQNILNLKCISKERQVEIKKLLANIYQITCP